MKTVFLLAFLVATNLVVFAQDEVKKPTTQNASKNQSHNMFDSIKKRIYFGGNVGAAFGTTTYINVQPLVGFKITPKLSVGAGFTYNYFSQRYAGTRYVSYVYGSNVFARYLILPNLFAQVGWDKLSVPDYTSNINGARRWVDNVLVGGGYRQKFSENASAVVAIFYNVNQSIYSPYVNPIMQVGFNIGF